MFNEFVVVSLPVFTKALAQRNGVLGWNQNQSDIFCGKGEIVNCTCDLTSADSLLGSKNCQKVIDVQ